MLKCEVCSKDLIGKQTKFCSNKCKCSVSNNRFQRYEQQRERGFKNKLEVFISRGGKCEICGYKKNLSALDFHHIIPENKSFGIDMRSFSNNTSEKLKAELEKCMMICANCHRELHNPSYSL